MSLLSEMIAAKLSGGGGGGGSGTDNNAVHYSADSGKTDAERAAALANVGGEPKKMTVTFTYASSTYTANRTIAEIYAAHAAGKTVEAEYNNETYRLSYSTSIVAMFVSANEDGVGNPYIDSFFGVNNALTGDDDWEFHDINIAEGQITTAVSGSTPTIAAEDNHIYECGELTSLTVTAIDNPGEFSITFTSGATPTVLTVPNTMIMPDGFAVEANTRYEINVKDGYALVAGWAVSA